MAKAKTKKAEQTAEERLAETLVPKSEQPESGNNGIIELINPVIAKISPETQEVLEGSIAPGAPRGHVIRPQCVIVEAFDRNGIPISVAGTGFLAATFCHEIDHLDGIMFADKVNSL